MRLMEVFQRRVCRRRSDFGFGFFILAVCLLKANSVAAEPRQLNLPLVPLNYVDLALPDHFRRDAERFDNTPGNNPITNEGATLGRVLFYDPKLSVNQTTSCASCHRQENAFSDPRRRSLGFDGRVVARNSMSLVNVRYYSRGRMFWDERADTLEQQVLMPIENEIEMGHDLDVLLAEIAKDETYQKLFKAAFGHCEIDRTHVARALAQFVRSIVSYRSKFDQGLSQARSVRDDFAIFTKEENLGKSVFFGRARCAECHLEDTPGRDAPQVSFFYARRPMVNGIDSLEPGKDRGVADFSGKDQDVGKFKIPSLRNIELTGPYMHDGRFHTLDQVIEHYNWSVRPHENLDPRLEDFAANGLALPETPKVALAAFLLTLTDRELVNDPRYSDPFVETAK